MTHGRLNDARTSLQATRFVLLVSLVVAFVLVGASSALAITRDEVLARAQRRIDSPVPYSQSKYYAGYRTDCSGYVSMCWKTGTSWNTRTFYKVSHTIPVSQLLPGDAMLKKGYHIRLFYGWVDDEHTQYVAYESASKIIAGTRIHSIAEDLGYGYVPTRYDRIQSSPKPTNVLKNPSFNTWAGSWSGADEQPIWWQAGNGWWDPLAVHRKDVYRTARNSLELLNPSEDPAEFSELAQTATIVPGANYRLNAWAKSAFDPAGVEVGLTYLDALDQALAESRTTGDAWGVNPGSYKMMSVLMTAPPEAVRARVTVRLAGGSTETSAGIIAGTSVLLDDISLARPQVLVGMKASRATAYSGNTVTLSGAVAPKRAIGYPAIIYVQRPGTTWKVLATKTVYASGSAGEWKGAYTFTRSMPRGTYRFKTYVPRIPGYLGATSSIVSVRLR